MQEITSWLPLLGAGLVVTGELALATLLLSMMWGGFLAVCAISPYRSVRVAARLWINLFRSIPILALLLFIYFGLGKITATWPIPPLALPILALTLSESAYLSELYRAGLQSIPNTQLEAAASLGFGWIGIVRRVIVPQAMAPAIPGTLNSLIYIIKDSALASLIGTSEVTLQASILVSETFQPMKIYLVLAGLYIALIVPLTLLANRAERFVAGRFSESTKLAADPAMAPLLIPRGSEIRR
jgi:His/Glu/Gln/Arg/opine family amino acid ABC transporter permease subunit